MDGQIALLDCTLRDGAYITGGNFGSSAIKGIIKNLQDARVEIIECGWLKDAPHEEGSTYYHIPSDMEKYLLCKRKEVEYVAMIDWDRYNVDNLPVYDGKSIDAVRVVFPHGKHKEGIEIGKRIREKGYKVYFQAANTLAYSEEDLKELVLDMNEFKPVALSVVDTFGAMFESDLDRILNVVDENLLPEIKLGFHAHNNQQLAFALSMHFVETLGKTRRKCIVDSTLCGMGRGAGNTTTELISNYLNRKQHCNYDLDAVMDAIDKYMQEFSERFSWGYSTPYFIAGIYQCHVNNIAYLLDNHRTNSKDMRNIIASLSSSERRKYDYDILEKKYLDNQNHLVDDKKTIDTMAEKLKGRDVVLLCPGSSLISQYDKIKKYIDDNNPVVIGVGGIVDRYAYDYLFFANHARYEYAQESYPDMFGRSPKILLSNIKTSGNEDEFIVNFGRVIKQGWKYFDNPAISALRLMDELGLNSVSIAGFDAFKNEYNESYADKSIPAVSKDDFEIVNTELKEMYLDYKQNTKNCKKVNFLTESPFDL